jgi:hypothetical protein
MNTLFRGVVLLLLFTAALAYANDVQERHSADHTARKFPGHTGSTQKRPAKDLTTATPEARSDGSHASGQYTEERGQMRNQRQEGQPQEGSMRAKDSDRARSGTFGESSSAAESGAGNKSETGSQRGGTASQNNRPASSSSYK